MAAFAKAAFGRGLLDEALRDRTFAIPYSDVFMSLSPEPWPHLVHYEGGRVTYTPPDHFYLRSPSGPSDCVWMVPPAVKR